MIEFFMLVYKQGWFYGCIGIALAIGCIGTIIFFKLVKHTRRVGNKNLLKKITDSIVEYLPSYILILAFLLALSSMILSLFNKSMNSSIYEFFVSFIFAWLLTKVSSEKENQRKQKELAKKSFRHLLGLANSISHVQNDIVNRMLDAEENEQNRERLYNILNSFGNIYQGIMSAKEDWGDILGDEKYDLEKEYIGNIVSHNAAFKSAFGKFGAYAKKASGQE